METLIFLFKFGFFLIIAVAFLGLFPHPAQTRQVQARNGLLLVAICALIALGYLAGKLL